MTNIVDLSDDTRHRKLHAHHVRFWSQNGTTDLANLLPLCSRHHTLVHAQGFQLRLHPDRSLTVRTTDGTAVLHHPSLPWHPAEEPEAATPASTKTDGVNHNHHPDELSHGDKGNGGNDDNDESLPDGDASGRRSLPPLGLLPWHRTSFRSSSSSPRVT
ncbi:MAG: HNH endonuclease [Actinomycetota bacterium]|nr:HNH endonuclease [Actinomycetota bacterium]